MDAKEFLKEKGISNNDFMDSGVADLIETLLTEYQTFQLQQASDNVQLCDNLDKNYNCKNMCLTRCVNGDKFYK